MFVLHVKPIRGKPFSQPLNTELIIGRSRTCDVVINDEAISRRHVRIFPREDDWYLEDLGSRNGTLVDDCQVVEPVILLESSMINLSGNTLYLSRDSSYQDPESSPALFGGTLLRSATDLLSRNSFGKDSDDGTLKKVAGRLSLLNELHGALGKPLTTDALLELVLEKVFDQLRPEEGCIYLKEGERLIVAARRTLPGCKESSLYSQTLVEEVATRGQAALITDLATDERFNQSQSMVSAGIRSLVAAPLMDSEGIIGMLVLASRAAVRSFNEDDMALLVSLSSLSALRIRNLKLMEEAARHLRDLNEELERKVAERTAALAETNRELLAKNEEILRKQKQLLVQAKMASVGTMAAGVAHLIKNPLNFVKNLSEVSSDLIVELQEIFTDEVRARLESASLEEFDEIVEDLKANCRIVHNHGVRADQIVVSLMDYAREPGKVDRSDQDIAALVVEYTELAIHSRLGKKGEPDPYSVEVKHYHQPNTGSLNVYAGDLSRTIINLVNNCLDGIEARAENETRFIGKIQTFTERIHEHVVIRIRDNGEGIEPRNKDEVFTPFFTTRHDDSHLGLGLSMSFDAITERHNGSLKLSSEYGSYTEVEIRLPLKQH